MRYIIRDYYYDPPEEIIFKNKDQVIQHLLERIGDVDLVVKK